MSKEIMNIEKALSHFEYKFKNHWKPSVADIKAFNAILDYKETNDRKVTMENESFAKLYIHQLMLLCNSNHYSGERALQVIDEILTKSVYEWVLSLKESIGIMRYNSIIKENSGSVDGKEKELTEALMHQSTEEKIIKFINSQITRTINKFEKNL